MNNLTKPGLRGVSVAVELLPATAMFLAKTPAPTLAALPASPARQRGWLHSSWVRWSAAGSILFVPYLAALALKSYGLHHSVLIGIGWALSNTDWHNIGECVAAVLCVAAGLIFRRRGTRALRGADRAIARFASRPTQAILFVGALPLIVRIALLPVLGVPQPLVADEFGYLLLADTFASGRLTNPPHPFWQHFEAVYVFNQPSYTSIYPVAPAILMALAKALGAHPWFGVWFGAGLMCALVCWMLQGWLPPKWAFIGGLLAVFRFTIVSPWMNAYWGGAAAAAGGALVLGALPRIMKHQRPRDALLLALGLGVLSQSRPYEGAFFSLPLAAALAYWLLTHKSVAPRIRLTRVALPLAVALAVLAAGTLVYQARVTGEPLLPPYLLHQRIYGTPQTTFWQKPVPEAPGVHRQHDIEEVFRWQLQARQAGFSWYGEKDRLGTFWQFYLQPLLSVPLLLLPLVLRKRRMLAPFLSGVALLAGNAMYPFFFVHYAAPMCGLTILLIAAGMRRLSLVRFRARPAFGMMVCSALLIAIAASAAANTFGRFVQPSEVVIASTARGEAIERLKERGGKHLVLVRYSLNHLFHWGAVYNGADIDSSPVIWARQLDPASDKALARYYSGREAWLFNPDQTPARLYPFTDKPYVTAFAGGAGPPGDGQREGISPGSIAVILGGNFVHGLEGTTNPQPLHRLPVRLLGISPEHGALFTPCEPRCAPGAAVPPYPLSYAGFSVRFGAASAPILAVSRQGDEDAVIVQVPFEAPRGETVVTLRAGQLVSTKHVTILPSSPGILQLLDSGVRGIVLHANGELVDSRRPAHRGEVLRLFATGLGPLLPPPATNQPGPARDGAEPAQRVIVGVNHAGAPLLSERYAEGMVGVEALEFQVPPDTPDGPDIPLSVAVLSGRKVVYSNKSSLAVR